MKDGLFLPRAEGEDDLYGRIRDDPRGEEHRTQLEAMWGEYQDRAPKGFRRKLQCAFHQRWWEMCLAVGLLNIGHNIQTSKRDYGPDFRLSPGSNRTIWLEAVAPGPGITGQALPELSEGVFDLPEEQFLLRLSSALRDKKNGLASYISKGIVGQQDCYIVAISACALNQFGSLMDFPAPAPLKVLAGMGTLVLDKDGNYTAPRQNLVKPSGAEVDLRLFDDPCFSGVSAVLYSTSDPLNCPDTPQDKFQLFLNPLAHSPLPAGLFTGVEIWSQVAKDQYQATWKKGRDSS